MSILSAWAERAEVQHGSNSEPAKRAQKVKGTHTVSPRREKSISVSSALNACQAFDISFESLIGKQKATDKAESSGGLHLAGSLSCNVSGVTIRVSKVCDLDMDLRSLFHLNHSVVTPLCY